MGKREIVEDMIYECREILRACNPVDGIDTVDVREEYAYEFSAQWAKGSKEIPIEEAFALHANPPHKISESEVGYWRWACEVFIAGCSRSKFDEIAFDLAEQVKQDPSTLVWLIDCLSDTIQIQEHLVPRYSVKGEAFIRHLMRFADTLDEAQCYTVVVLCTSMRRMPNGSYRSLLKNIPTSRTLCGQRLDG